MSDSTPGNLVDALQVEIRRVRDQVLPVYADTGSGGLFAVIRMLQVLKGWNL